VARSIEQREGHRGEYVEGDNGGAWNSTGRNLQNPRAGVGSKNQAQREGDPGAARWQLHCG